MAKQPNNKCAIAYKIGFERGRKHPDLSKIIKIVQEESIKFEDFAKKQGNYSDSFKNGYMTAIVKIKDILCYMELENNRK